MISNTERDICIKALLAKHIEYCSNNKIKFDDAFRGLCNKDSDRNSVVYKAITVVRGKSSTWQDNIFDFIMQNLEMRTAPQPFNGDITTKLSVRLQNDKFSAAYMGFKDFFINNCYNKNKKIVTDYIESCFRTSGKFEFNMNEFPWYC